MFIWKDTQKRANIYAPYTSPEGVRYSTTPRELLDEIPDPVRESDETHYNQEINDPPYLISTPKPQEQIDASHNERIKQQIRAIELQELAPRFLRDLSRQLTLQAAAGLGITEEQLLDPQNPAYSPGYAKFIIVHREVATLRGQLK